MANYFQNIYSSFYSFGDKFRSHKSNCIGCHSFRILRLQSLFKTELTSARTRWQMETSCGHMKLAVKQYIFINSTHGAISAAGGGQMYTVQLGRCLLVIALNNSRNGVSAFSHHCGPRVHGRVTCCQSQLCPVQITCTSNICSIAVNWAMASGL